MLVAVFEKLDVAIQAENRQQQKYGLLGTMDLDAKINGEHFVKEKLQAILQEESLELDPTGHEVWYPKESTFTEIFTTPRLICRTLDPIYSLTSKAVKAKEKNRILVAAALSFFGEELEKLIVEYGGTK